MVVNSVKKKKLKRTCLVGSCLFKLVSFVLEPEIRTDLTQPMYEFAKKNRICKKKFVANSHVNCVSCKLVW